MWLTFIRGKGERADEYEDHWPLNYCTDCKKLTGQRSNLIELTDSRHGLLDAMLSVDCISEQQKHSVESGTTDENKNDILYSIVLWGSLATYKAFITCLLRTNQPQVVFLLEPSLVGDIRPLDYDQKSRIKRNYETLVETIDSKNGLTAELLAAGCITRRQREYIEHIAITQSESNQRLIDIVRRGSETDYQKFIDCLNKTGQHHVSRILVEDGAVAYIVATINPGRSKDQDQDQQERRIVDQLKASLRDTPVERREALINEALTQLRENEVSILTAEIGHSIGLFYFTTSLRGLQYLHELYSSTRLGSIMQDIFVLLLKPDDAELNVALRWDFSNYTDCLQQLCTITNLPILSEVYEMVRHNRQLIAMCDDVRSLPIDQFPFELIEMILIRATGHLFVTINRRKPRAEVYALATMTAVSRLWRLTLSYRKYIKRLLKRSFKRICHPFKCSPQRVSSLHIEGGNDVRGVAVLGDKLLVAVERSNVIRVFDSRRPFSRQDDIRVEELNDASDITVCHTSKSLFVADSGTQGTQGAIWRVKLSATKQIDKFIAMQWQPMSLSVSNSRLLITPFDGDSLYLYGDDGNELHHIELPSYMNAQHAVETTLKTYVVSHRCRNTSSHRDSVTEVDVNGRPVRSFNDEDIDSIRFNWPRYMVLDKSHVIIADRFNDRVVLLKSDLQLERVLINSLHFAQPRRLCLTSTRCLVVGYWSSTEIDIYQV